MTVIPGFENQPLLGVPAVYGHMNFHQGVIRQGQDDLARGNELIHFQTGIQQGSENHIAAGTGKAVKICYFHLY